MATHIRRGTTPKQVFTFKVCNISVFDEILITYLQGNEIVIEKNMDDLTIDGNKVWFRLTQEETLALHSGLPVEIQIRAHTKDDNAAATSIFEVDVERIINTSILD